MIYTVKDYKDIIDAYFNNCTAYKSINSRSQKLLGKLRRRLYKEVDNADIPTSHSDSLTRFKAYIVYNIQYTLDISSEEGYT